MPLTDGPQFSTRRDLHLLRGDPPVALWKLLSISFGSGRADPASGTFDTWLRVHVHQSVERIRMSPSRLSIHRPKATGDCNTNYGFTVRAEFDDGTSADITTTSHYRADPIDAECFCDSSEESPCLVKLPAGLGPGSLRTLSIVTTPEWNSRAAHADIDEVRRQRHRAQAFAHRSDPPTLLCQSS